MEKQMADYLNSAKVDEGGIPNGLSEDSPFPVGVYLEENWREILV